MLRYCFVALFSGLLLLPANSIAQAENQFPLLDSLKSVLDQNQQVKASYCIYKSGKVVAQGSFGYEPADFTYRIGSITKTFTAALILKAAEDGKIKLSDPIDKWFPEIANAQNITIEMLLNHRSGIHNFTNDASYPQIMETQQSRANMLQRFSSMEPDFEPGSDFKYSNTNYVLASYILETVYEQSMQELIEKYINKPAKLKNTYFFLAEKKDEREVDSYYWSGSWNVLPRTHPSIPMGAGAIASNPEDLCRFMRSLHQGDIINSKSLSKMKGDSDYGLGLMQFPFYTKVAYGHNGGIDGFQSHASYFPKEDLAIALCINGAQYPMNDLLIDLLSIYFDRADYELPKFNQVDLEVAELEQYIGTYRSANFPMDIKVFIEDGQIKAQATGQASFPLKALGDHQFEFKAAGISILFEPENNVMLFEQGGMKVKFER